MFCLDEFKLATHPVGLSSKCTSRLFTWYFFTDNFRAYKAYVPRLTLPKPISLEEIRPRTPMDGSCRFQSANSSKPFSLVCRMLCGEILRKHPCQWVKVCSQHPARQLKNVWRGKHIVERSIWHVETFFLRHFQVLKASNNIHTLSIYSYLL